MSERKNKYAKIVVYTPLSHTQKIRDILNLYSGGKIRNYDYCSFSIQGIGRFRPLKGANPHIGTVNNIEEVKEERIETIILQKDIKRIIQTIKKNHPYEEPAIDVYPLLYP